MEEQISVKLKKPKRKTIELIINVMTKMSAICVSVSISIQDGCHIGNLTMNTALIRGLSTIDWLSFNGTLTNQAMWGHFRPENPIAIEKSLFDSWVGYF